MKLFQRILILAAAAFLGSTGCVHGPVHGILFTSTDFAGQLNTASDVPISKTARGCIHQVLFTVAWGDATAGTVAMENGISQLAIIDHSTASFLGGVYSRYCTKVAGN